MTAEYRERVKRALRRTGNGHNDEIKALIDGAREDLILRGIPRERVEREDNQTVFLYVRYHCLLHFGILAPEDYDKTAKALETIRNFLMFTGGAE